MKFLSIGAACLAVLFSLTSAYASDSTPLVDALKANDLATAHSLLKQDADVNATHSDGMTALHWAVYHDDLATTKLLIDAGAKVNSQNRYGIPALSLACKNGNAEIVELLLQAGADPNATIEGGETVLMTAARTGVVGSVESLVAHGADVNAKERKGQTALMWAAADGHADVVDALVHAGADFRESVKSGFTAFFFAVRQGHADVVSRLLQAGIDVNDTMQPDKSATKQSMQGTSPLVLAVENGHLELAIALLDAGADPNDDQAGFTALHAITWVRKPVRGDGDPSPVGSGRIASLEFVRELLTHGADVNALHGKQGAGNGKMNRTGATAFLLASETGDLPLLKLLLELGADPTLANVDQCTPLLAAAGVGVLSNGDESAGTEEEAIETVQLMLELGADINAVEEHGESAMHGAAYKSWTKLVQFLADNGADINVWNQKNKRNWTPLKIAEGNRPGNFRPSPETVEAIQRLMRSAQANR